MSEKLWQPFSNGTEKEIWYGRNCEGCRLYNYDSLDGSCEIEAELGQGVLFGDGITKELVEKIGGTEKSEHTGDVDWLCNCQHKQAGDWDEKLAEEEVKAREARKRLEENDKHQEKLPL